MPKVPGGTMLFLRQFDEIKVIQLTSEGLLPEFVRF
jgi:hypothetical protein